MACELHVNRAVQKKIEAIGKGGEGSRQQKRLAAEKEEDNDTANHHLCCDQQHLSETVLWGPMKTAVGRNGVETTSKEQIFPELFNIKCNALLHCSVPLTQPRPSILFRATKELPGWG